MAWFPCGCCCPPGDKVLVWPGTGGGIGSVENFYASMLGADDVHIEAEFTGDIADYGVIFTFDITSDPVWWGQLSTWNGTLVMSCLPYDFFGNLNTTAQWINTKTGTTGIEILSVPLGTPDTEDYAVVLADPLTNGVVEFFYGRSFPLSGGTGLFARGATPIVAHNKPGNIRYVVSGGSGWDNWPFVVPPGDTEHWLENLYTQRPRPTCTPRTDHIGSTSGGIDWGFATAALIGLAALQSTVSGPTFSLSGNLTSGANLQATGASSLTFSPSAAMTGAAAATGSSSLTFSSTSGLNATGVLSGSTSLSFIALLGESRNMIGHSFLTFSTSGSATGAGRLTATSSLTFTTAGGLTTTAPTLSGSATLTFSEAADLRGTAPLSGTSSLTFAPTVSTTGTAGISAATSLTFSTAGQLLATAPLSGSLTTTFLVIGHELDVSGQLTGSSSLAFTPSAAVVGSGRLAGSLTTTFLVHGPASTAGQLAGASTLTFSEAATLLGAGRLTGSLTTTFSASAAGVESAVATGTTNLTFTTAGQLRGSGRLVAASTLTFSTQGNLTGTGGGGGECTECVGLVPASKVVTLSGIGNRSCGLCSDLSDSFVLTPLGENQCVLNYLDGDFPCGTLDLQLLYLPTSVEFFISIGALTGEGKFQKVMSAGYECDDIDGVYELVHDTSSMCDFSSMTVVVGSPVAQLSGSSSLTFTPSGELSQPCSVCATGTTPRQYLLSLSGSVANLLCTSCSQILGDYVLTQNPAAPCEFSYTATITCGSLEIFCELDQNLVAIVINGSIEAILTFSFGSTPFDCHFLTALSVYPEGVLCDMSGVNAVLQSITP